MKIGMVFNFATTLLAAQHFCIEAEAQWLLPREERIMLREEGAGKRRKWLFTPSSELKNSVSSSRVFPADRSESAKVSTIVPPVPMEMAGTEGIRVIWSISPSAFKYAEARMFPTSFKAEHSSSVNDSLPDDRWGRSLSNILAAFSRGRTIRMLP